MRKTSGNVLVNGFVFMTFCPGSGCPVIVLYNFTMRDVYGDGWNGYILGVKQNGTIVGTFG